VQARAELMTSGVGTALIDAVLAMLASRGLASGAVVVELGSGTGNALAAVAGAHAIDGVGIDLSTAAADHAARRFPGLTWVVANADRRLPLLDGSGDLILSLHARRNPVECARALRPDGRLLIAVPAADDLIELRGAVQGEALERPRFDSLVAEHAPLFTVMDRASARERQTLDAAALQALVRATYRGGRRRVHEKLETLTSLNVTLASELVLFRPSEIKG
jgi:23S rRNA (guanine745-N1)-methyltransferase